MLYAFILGIGLMVGLAFLIPWLTQVEPGNLLRVLKWAVFGVLTLVFLGLLFTGRLGWAIAALAAMIPWLLRLARLFVFGRVLNQTFGNPFGNPFRGLGDGPANGRGGVGSSEVRSRFLHMGLDLDSGAMSGRVVAGRFAGRDLESLSLSDALDLRAEVAGDADSLRLLETWLDRAHPGWGDDWGAQEEASAPPGGARMDRAEALRVLGLEEGADDGAIRDAYRRLMAQAHPDRGGSAWLAAKLNEARDVLLGARKRS